MNNNSLDTNTVKLRYLASILSPTVLEHTEIDQTKPMAPPPPILVNLFSISTLILILTLILASPPASAAEAAAACGDTCGSLQVKYPFGTGPGCGSPLFSPYITCTSNGTGDQLFLKTHTGSYPITSISYATSTLTIAPPQMSTCTSMQTSQTNFGLDWTSPFQIGSSTFILLSCQPPTSSLAVRGSPICDPSFDYLCDAIYSCPAVVALGLSLFPPANTCCVYSPANLDGEGELELTALGCGAYASVVSLGDKPIDPTHWVYGVALKYSSGALDSNFVTTKCNGCQTSGGVCGYAPPGNGFVCVCGGGYNTTLDCPNYAQNQDALWGSTSSPLSTPGFVWSSILAGIVSSLALTKVMGG